MSSAKNVSVAGDILTVDGKEFRVLAGNPPILVPARPLPKMRGAIVKVSSYIPLVRLDRDTWVHLNPYNPTSLTVRTEEWVLGEIARQPSRYEVLYEGYEDPR